MKNGEITISGQISETYTGTPLNLYRYSSCSSKNVSVQPKPVLVHPSRTEPVSVQVKAVPVPMAPIAPIFVIFTYLS